ncbi:ABC transporter substrate-binding protein [Mesobacterium sp. TK19101]|uniref:ABC transporter substrate-binding protein n=1 Tax=Mesobacterium hydrothermale TaxID=3111907 RepID=A0ABU6HGY2_9RHOB|nr:ABC transporter substrate-binding protein [Mesobacterium sp. TK19101]MEC3861722.1 ABC transporter substrate-binding protein [Mesobacterium sp. TK19101]
MLKHILCAAALWLGATTLAQADMPVLRAAMLETGTVNWELDTIKHNGFDAANGFDLQVQGMAGNPATRIAFQAGEADLMVADWIWVARQRAAGKDYVFVPYSKAVGALLVAADDPARTLADMAGRKIGIAGGPVDKSWLILRAYARQAYGMDLAAETEQVFGAPPLIFKAGLSGDIDGAINFWHFAAKMEAKGMRPLITVSDAAMALGLDPEVPLLGYVFHGAMVAEHPELVAGFVAASRAAKDALATDPAAWDRLRPMMRAASDADFAALKAGFLAGIPAPGPIDTDAAAKMLHLMAELGGEKLVGAADSLPEGVFVQPLN